MKIYLAGKITGAPDYHRLFAAYAQLAVDRGAVPLNPAVLPAGLEDADYMRICLSMLDSADLVWFLPGWQESLGARLEFDYCNRIGKPWEAMGWEV